VVLTVANMDTANVRAGWLELDLGALGVAPGESFQVHDVLSDARHLWSGARAYVSLDPRVCPAAVYVVRRKVRSEHDFEYFL
jgi:starch synthase (maltosyl-transferring)